MDEVFIIMFLPIATPNEIDFVCSGKVHEFCCRLTYQERERIWNEMQFAIIRMFSSMEEAEKETAKILCPDVRETTKAVIQGAIGGLAGRSPYSVVVGACLGALAHISGEAYVHFNNACDYVENAKYWAWVADTLQDRLWMDE